MRQGGHGPWVKEAASHSSRLAGRKEEQGEDRTSKGAGGAEAGSSLPTPCTPPPFAL